MLVVRWTHDTIDGRAIFCYDQHQGQSIYKSLDQFWRGEKAVVELDSPLDVEHLAFFAPLPMVGERNVLPFLAPDFVLFVESGVIEANP